jgi:hypothetical protein
LSEYNERKLNQKSKSNLESEMLRRQAQVLEQNSRISYYSDEKMPEMKKKNNGNEDVNN